ncbi:MAG TPA: AEC family transporter [Parachlamydiaceae bacterium]|nr:AEC family transporter [Parachlamydiaceae bacterium]
MIHLCLPFLLKVVPLYINIILGFVAGKFVGIARDSIARLMIYLFVPLVIFNGVINTKLDLGILSLPFITFMISAGLCLFFYWLSKFIWQDYTRNLVALSAGTGNTGYFGLPLALLLFNDQGEGIYIMAILGITVFENTLGFYMIARGRHTAAECISKLIRLPAIYALLAGLIVNMLHIPVPDVFIEFMKHIKGAYTVMGMMIIGVGIAGIKQFKVDFSFIGITFLAKFIAWPLLIALAISLDTHFFGFFDETIYQALILLSLVPLAANVVILATLMDIHPDKAATAVLLSTILSIIYIPLMVGCFIL